MHTCLALAMAPKIRYDAAHMQTKADESAEKEIQNVTREGIELPRSAEVTCEYLGVLKNDGFTLAKTPTLRSTVGYKSTLLKPRGLATITPQGTVPVCQSNGKPP